ncbi:MAG: hypothetical protein M3R17_05935 [Bacteroidota bacterium]|nr:hypothetical protein [Bacteroidota bacterium]
MQLPRGTCEGLDRVSSIKRKINYIWFILKHYADKNGLNYFKGNRYSIAGEKKEGDAPFTEQVINLSGPVNFYLSSDGFVDQFGEKTGKKFLSKRFQKLLGAVSALPLNEQQARIEKEFESWKGNLEQVDGILVMGIRV